MNTFLNCHIQIDVSCSFLALVTCRAAVVSAARFTVIFVDGFMTFFVCCIPLDKVQTLSFSDGMALVLQVITPGGKIQGVLLGYVHLGCSAVWSEVSDGTTEC